MTRGTQLWLAALAALILGVCPMILAAAADTAPAATKAGQAANVQQPKDKTSADGMAGTKVEEFKLTCPAMKRDIEVIVVLPPGYATDTLKRYPVLYTLHGRGAPFRVFKDMTTVHKALAKQPMIVVGFNADRASWYLDATKKADSQFTSFFFNTLIPAIDAHYRTQADAAHRAVTGFSMGGFGALYYMLAKPDMFASASAMSGAFDPLAASGSIKKDFVELLGTAEENPRGYALLNLSARLKAAAASRKIKLPPIYVTCGSEDFLIAQNHAMRDLLKSLKLPSEYVEGPGVHDFKFWKAAATGVIDFHWRTFQGDYKPVDDAKDAAEQTKEGAVSP